MSTGNLISVKLEGTESRIRKILKDLDGRAAMVVRGGGTVLYVGVPASELGWLDTVAKDIGCKKQEVESLPGHDKALCGILTVSRRYHEGRCKACARIRAQLAPAEKEVVRKPRVRADKVIAKLEPGAPLNLDGVISSIEVTRDQLWEKVESIDNLLTNLKAYRDAKEKFTELKAEADKRVDAVKLLLRDGEL